MVSYGELRIFLWLSPPTQKKKENKKETVDIRIICQIYPFQQSPSLDMSSKSPRPRADFVFFFFFLKEEYSTVCVGWESAVHNLVIHANKQKKKKKSSPARTKNSLPEMLIVPCLSLNPSVLSPLPSSAPIVEKPIEMTYFYPPFFTLSFNLVTPWPDQWRLEIAVILLAYFLTCVGVHVCLHAFLSLNLNRDKDKRIWTACSLFSFITFSSVPSYAYFLNPQREMPLLSVSHSGERHSRSLSWFMYLLRETVDLK